MSDEMIDPALQACGSSEELDRLLQIRQVAQDAFMKLTSREAAAKTLRASEDFPCRGLGLCMSTEC